MKTVLFRVVVEAEVFVEQGDKGFLEAKMLENTGLVVMGIVTAVHTAALACSGGFEDL